MLRPESPHRSARSQRRSVVDTQRHPPEPETESLLPEAPETDGHVHPGGNGHRRDGQPPARRPAETVRAIAEPSDEESWWDHWKLVIAAVGCWSFLAVALLTKYLTGAPDSVVIAFFALSYLFGGTFATIAAVEDLLHRTVNVDLLMVTAAAGAAIVGHWEEGAILLGLFSSSNALEHFALGRTHRAVKSLMDLSPDEATLLRDDLPGGEQVVPVAQLATGDRVLIRPGEQIPVDGEIVAGESSIDQAAITGESVPVHRRPGQQVFAGTMNTTGALEVKVTRLAQESTLARIIRIVDEAREQKSRTQRFTDRFEGRYTILVIVGSVLAFLGFWQIGDMTRDDAFYRAITLLVVASPCALVISTPASTLSGLANAARNGVLFKGSGHLENLGMTRVLAFDKTGTLTVGKPVVTDVIPCEGGWSERDLLVRAASAERLSEHPLADAIVSSARERGLPLEEALDFRAVPGKGLKAHVDGHEVAIGSPKLFADLGIDLGPASEIADRLRSEGKTAMLVGDSRRVQGVIAVADTLRPSASGVVGELKDLGVQRIVMLTGDHELVAQAIARQVGVDEVQAELLPEEKLTFIHDLAEHGNVAMVGDGVNDAPALASATVGVAMGGAGSDVALETADVVLIADDLTKLPYAVALSQRTRRTIIQNLTFSLAVIVVLVVSALTIGIPLPLGVVGHEGSTIIVVLNGLRLLRNPR
jgi:Zn2+/Cd2+-exporting ATPase